MDNVRLLLQYKASLITKDFAGLTAYDIAESGAHSECAQLLKETAGKNIFIKIEYFLVLIRPK